MNVFTHPEYIKDQLRRAKRIQRIGLLCVVLSFFLSFGFGFNYLLVYLAYPFLIAGFPMWTIGRSNARRLALTPRPETLLNNELKGLNNKYSLHHYVNVNGRVIEHLLITPAAAIVIHLSDAVGPIFCNGGSKGDAWRSQSNLLDRLTGAKPSIGNPTRTLDQGTAIVRDLLAQNGKPNVSVKGVVAFTRNPDIEVDGCSYPAVPLNEIKQTVRDLQFDMGLGGSREDTTSDINSLLTSDDRRRLNATLSPQMPAVAPKAQGSRQNELPKARRGAPSRR
jgi:hypothetical protein